LIGALSCGARTTLDTPSGPAPTCGPPTAWTPCATWQPAGSQRRISGNGTGRESFSFAAIATGCSALVAWSSSAQTGDALDVQFDTSVVAWDGSPTTPIAHTALGAQVPVNDPGWWELAADHGTFGAIASIDQGHGFPGSSRFVRLDASGAEQGAPISLDPMAGALGATGGGFSALYEAQVDGPVTLEQIHADGSIAKTLLPSEHGVGSRLVYDDGSFLLHTVEGAGSAVERDWLQHFDAHGVALAPEVELTSDSGVFDVQLTATAAGAVAAWALGGIYAVALDRDGNMTSSIQKLAATGAVVGLSAANGDVVVSWLSEYDTKILFQALRPDATARGPAVQLAGYDGISTRDIQIPVEPNGMRALFLFVDESNGVTIDALPLRCAD
jgi:hypothetical protein